MKRILMRLVLTTAVLMVGTFFVQTTSAQGVDGLQRNQHLYDLEKGAALFTLSATCENSSCTQLQLKIYDENKLITYEDVECTGNDITESYYYTDLHGILQQGEKVIGYKNKCKVAVRLDISENKSGVYSAVVENRSKYAAYYRLTAEKDKVACEEFNGEWSWAGGPMSITVRGNKAEGKYHIIENLPGSFVGTISGNTLEGIYTEPNYPDTKRMISGSVKFTKTANGLLYEKGTSRGEVLKYDVRCKYDVKYNPKGAEVNQAIIDSFFPIFNTLAGTGESLESIPEKSETIFNAPVFKGVSKTSAASKPAKTPVVPQPKNVPAKTSAVAQPKKSPAIIKAVPATSKKSLPVTPKPEPKKELTPAEKNEQLLIASVSGTTESVEQLIADGADPNTTKEGFTPLMIAAFHGRSEIVEKLLLNSADVNAKNVKGVTVLMMAARTGYVETVRLLIASGANICSADNNGSTAINYAELKSDDATAVATLNPEGRNNTLVAELLKKEQLKQCQPKTSPSKDTPATSPEQSPKPQPAKKESKTKKKLKGILDRIIKIN